MIAANGPFVALYVAVARGHCAPLHGTGLFCTLLMSFALTAALYCAVLFRLSLQSNGGNFEPLHKLQAHDSYILKCLLSPEFCESSRYASPGTPEVHHSGQRYFRYTTTGILVFRPRVHEWGCTTPGACPQVHPWYTVPGTPLPDGTRPW